MDLHRHDTLMAFRSEALLELQGEQEGLRPAERLRELDRMPANLRSLDAFREAFVVTAVLGKCRPAAATNQMFHLRASRLKAGEKAQFDWFSDTLKRHMGGVSFGSHGYRDRQLADADSEVVFAGVRTIISTLKELGYDAFANSGTLLGLVREKGLIPHDDDIDLAVILKARLDADAATEFSALMHSLQKQGIDCHRIASKNIILKLPNIDGFEVDLFPAYGAHRRYNIFPYSRKKLVFADVWPLQTCPVSGLPMPARPEVLLAQNYGDDWEVPNPHYCFPWAEQKEKFAGLLKEFASHD